MRLPFALLAAALVLAGCTNGDETPPTTTTQDTPTPTPTATPSAPPTPTPTTTPRNVTPTSPPTSPPTPPTVPTPPPAPRTFNETFDLQLSSAAGPVADPTAMNCVRFTATSPARVVAGNATATWTTSPTSTAAALELRVSPDNATGISQTGASPLSVTFSNFNITGENRLLVDVELPADAVAVQQSVSLTVALTYFSDAALPTPELISCDLG